MTTTAGAIYRQRRSQSRSTVRAEKRQGQRDQEPATPARKENPGPLTGARKARLPELIKPELATLVEKVPDGQWRYEVKFDGYRIMARIDHDEVKLFTRNGHDWTHKLPGQAEALAALHLESAWLDGEMVVVDEEGVPDFQALRKCLRGRSQRPHRLLPVRPAVPQRRGPARSASGRTPGCAGDSAQGR